MPDNDHKISEECLNEIRKLSSTLEELSGDIKTITGGLMAAGKFFQKWLPWIILIVSGASGVSPTLMKALYKAVTGHDLG